MSAAVIESIKWSAKSYFYSICRCCETDVWRVKQFLDCIVPFLASICERSSENRRHTRDWIIKLDITWEHGIETVPVCACFCHLSLTLKLVSIKLVILVYSRILSWKLYSPTHSTTNLGLSFGTVNCPDLRTSNWILVLLIRMKYVCAKRAKFAPVYSICRLAVWFKWERFWHVVEVRAGTLIVMTE
jgi:hypothetical protein